MAGLRQLMNEAVRDCLVSGYEPLIEGPTLLAGARMEAIAGALGDSLQVAFDRWHEWASRQCDFIVNGNPGITEEEYEAVARRFAVVGIEL